MLQEGISCNRSVGEIDISPGGVQVVPPSEELPKYEYLIVKLGHLVWLNSADCWRASWPHTRMYILQFFSGTGGLNW